MVTENTAHGSGSRPTRITKTYANTVVDAAAANRINAIYVTFDDYLEINALPAGANKDAKIKAYSDAVQSFVEIARAKGIAVDAEAGARDWGEPGKPQQGFCHHRLRSFVQCDPPECSDPRLPVRCRVVPPAFI
ncbi:MAG: hypothetical protein WDN09_03585 [bacterium]